MASERGAGKSGTGKRTTEPFRIGFGDHDSILTRKRASYGDG